MTPLSADCQYCRRNPCTCITGWKAILAFFLLPISPGILLTGAVAMVLLVTLMDGWR